MKQSLLTAVLVLWIVAHLSAQVEPGAGKWKTWFIDSVESYRLPPPPDYKSEIGQVLALQKDVDQASMRKIEYWSAGAPGYRWYTMASRLMMTDLTGNGALVNLLMGTAIYDATITAWDTKYSYRRMRPFLADRRIKALTVKAESPSYPCEHSVAAGVAATLIAHFYPALADSVNRMAKQAMESRIVAGLSFPSDTQAGFDLGKKIAEEEIFRTRDFITKKQWDGKVPQRPGIWNGKTPMLPMAGFNRTVVLDSASQFRPAPPPDFAKEMEELKNLKHNFRTQANAFHFASQPTGDDLLTKKVFEYNLHLNAPRAARLYAAVAVAYYDGFTACFDAKYAYWGIRPDQYDTTYKPLFPSPPFPGYPSGHAMMGGIIGDLFAYFFPAERELFLKVARDGAESRFQAGIHFRSDNNAGLELGRKIAAEVIGRMETDGADAQQKHELVGTKRN